MAQQFPNEAKPNIMDTKLIKQYGEEILSYRLRTARQKTRMQYEDFDKQLLALRRKQEELWARRRNLGWEPLCPPVQKGWKRFFVLRDDVARGKHAEFFQGILNKINTYDRSHKRDFLVRYRRFGRKKYRVKSQKLLEPCAHHFRKLGFTEAEQQLFYSRLYFENNCKMPVLRYVFTEPWRFVLKTEANMIDKVRIVDRELEAEIAFLSAYLEENMLQGRLDKLLDGSTKRRYWLYEKHTERNEFKNKSIRQILEMIKEE